MSLNYQSGPWDELNPRGDEKVSDFLQNLHSVLKNPEFLDVLSWNDGGDAFVVKDLLRMRDDVLPLYYNHNDLESFNKELINLGFQQVNIQNNQTLYFHLKFKMDPGSFTSHLAKQDDKIAKINFEIPVEGSTPRAGNGDASILDTVKNQIGNNELYWEFIKMKLRISEIEDSNSKVLKKVDELTARVESLQNELVSERQRNEQLIKQNGALNEQIYQSEAKNSEGKNPSSQMNSEDFEKTIANLEKALNLSGNIQLLQENLAMASAANDKRLILSNIERLRDFLKAKRSLEVLSQKKKKKRVDKEKRIQSDGEFRNGIDFQDRLMDQIRKIPKSESLNTTVFNQLAKNLPQTAAINSRFQGLGEQFSPFKIDELALRPFSTNQFSNGEHIANYTCHSTSPALRYATDHLITQQHGQEKVTIHSRVEQYQANYSGSMNTKPLETSFQNKNQLVDQDMLPFLQNPSEITLSMTRKASRDQIQESNPASAFFLAKDSQETTNHLNQPHFPRGVVDSLPEGTSTNYSPSAEFVSHLQKPVLPNDNFQLSGAENYLDNLSQLPLCHQQNSARGGEDLPHQFYYSDSNNTANKYMIGFEGQQPQVTENGTTNRETRADYDQRTSQQESTFDQYNNFSHSKVPHSSELDQLFQKSIHNYSL